MCCLFVPQLHVWDFRIYEFAGQVKGHSWEVKEEAKICAAKEMTGQCQMEGQTPSDSLCVDIGTHASATIFTHEARGCYRNMCYWFREKRKLASFIHSLSSAGVTIFLWWPFEVFTEPLKLGSST